MRNLLSAITNGGGVAVTPLQSCWWNGEIAAIVTWLLAGQPNGKALCMSIPPLGNAEPEDLGIPVEP